MIKEKIMTLLDIMTEEQAEVILDYIQETFELRKKTTWDNIEEDVPTLDEIKILKAYENGDDEYQPTISHEEIKKKLGIE